MEDERVVPLRPEYVLTAYELNHPQKPVDRSNDRWNAYKQKLPASCRRCPRFQNCGPGHKCRKAVGMDANYWPSK